MNRLPSRALGEKQNQRAGRAEHGMHSVFCFVFLYIRTSSFGADAERSYFFSFFFCDLRLKTFLRCS